MLLPSALYAGFALLVLGFLVELILPQVTYGKPRTVFGTIALALNSFALSAILVAKPGLFSSLFCLVVVYRIVNIMRAVEGRMHNAYLKRVVMRSTIALGVIQCAVGLSWLLSVRSHPAVGIEILLTFCAACALAAAIVLLLTAIRRLSIKQTSLLSLDMKLKDLPTVSLLIPARNETNDLHECLKMALESDYPKLEIIVLDDCSQDKTPEIIKQFAHDGVRFIQGEIPKDTWLAKNQAYERLAEESTGKLLLFIGVDVRLEKTAISSMVGMMRAQSISMLSVLPVRTGQRLKGVLIQPVRYFWELAIPSVLLRRPPVLSTCWIIEKSSYKKLGGMAAVTRTIIPEIYFARELKKESKYRFVRSTEQLKVFTIKSISEQISTAVRTRYPQLHRQPERVLVLSLFELIFLIAPFGLIVAAALMSNVLLLILSLLAAILLTATHVTISYVSNPQMRWWAHINFLPAIIGELVLVHVSMIRYEFGTVSWKGRNICLPIMHTVPHLPPIDNKRIKT